VLLGESSALTRLNTIHAALTKRTAAAMANANQELEDVHAVMLKAFVAILVTVSMNPYPYPRWRRRRSAGGIGDWRLERRSLGGNQPLRSSRANVTAVRSRAAGYEVRRTRGRPEGREATWHDRWHTLGCSSALNFKT